MFDFIVLGLILAGIRFSARYLIKQRKKGGGCSGCSNICCDKSPLK
jgi:hypothetical protein